MPRWCLAPILVACCAAAGARPASGPAVDRVLAFSEEGRAAVLERTTGAGPDVARSFLLVGLDGPQLEVQVSRVLSAGPLRQEQVSLSDCRDGARALQDAVNAAGFFARASVEVGACGMRSRAIVDVKRNLQVEPLSVGELQELQAAHGAGAFLAAPHGPLVLHLQDDDLNDAVDGARVVDVLARQDRLLHKRW